VSIGPDIAEALEEVGTAITIIKSGGAETTGEYIHYKINNQATKPFIREFFVDGWFYYNTATSAGDIIKFNVLSTYFLLMNLTPLLFENAIIQKNGVLYKCNVYPTLLRPREVRDPISYLTRTVWDTVTQFRGLITTPLYGHDYETDEEVGHFGLEVHEMYAQESLGIQINDRVFISSSEYYRVELIKPRRYEGINVYELGEDTRSWTTTTTTTSSSTTTTTA
jgi:hypothetical protein